MCIVILGSLTSLGEVALAKSVARSATVVCLQQTDFFVVDKEAFFKVGIDKFSKSEILYRESCVKSMELFRTVKDEICKDIADEGRVVTYLSDKLIEIDSSDSQFVYLITKGSCHVLRLINLVEQRRKQRRKKLRKVGVEDQPPPSSSIVGSRHDINKNALTLPLVTRTQPAHHKRTNNTNNKKPNHRGVRERNGERISSTVACLKVDHLHAGETFGLHFLFQDDTEVADNRRFSIISAGCEVMR